jgi:DNA polymerase-1
LILAIDTETTGVGWYDQAFMISAATGDFTRVYDQRSVSSAAWEDVIEETVISLCEAKSIIMHNAKFDIQKLCRLGVPLSIFMDTSRWEDTQAIAHLIDEQQSTGLKYLARTVLGEETDEDEVLKVWRRKNKIKKDEGYYPIPYDILAPYAAKDAEFTLRLYQELWPRFPESLYELYNTEKKLTLALLSIETCGFKIDNEYVSAKRKEYGDRIYKLKSSIGKIAGKDFNPQSHQQVLAALKQRGIRVDSTSKETLAGLDDELAQLILELREANKIKATYFDALAEEAKQGLLHPNFRQHGTRTGRMSSGSAEA